MSYEDKIILNNRLNKINKKSMFKDIFNLIKLEIENNMTVNSNGIFFNLNILSDKSLNKIVKYLDDNYEDNETTSIKFNSYSSDMEHSEFKLSNKERNLIKKIKNS